MKGFLQFDRYPRNFTNSAVLRDCWFNDLFIPYFVKDWAGGKGPPHPGLFGEFFSLVLGRLVGSDTLTLHVKSMDPDYFYELKCIEDTLAPKKIPYMLLPSFRSAEYGPDVGNLFFEWPVDSLELVRSEWFVSPQISVEGYITHGSCLPRLCEIYFAPDSEDVVRGFLAQIEIGFKVWRDNNGILLLSDKFDADGILERIQPEDIDALIAEAVREYEQL